jgi:hypothetical protein
MPRRSRYGKPTRKRRKKLGHKIRSREAKLGLNRDKE